MGDRGRRVRAGDAGEAVAAGRASASRRPNRPAPMRRRLRREDHQQLATVGLSLPDRPERSRNRSRGTRA